MDVGSVCSLICKDLGFCKVDGGFPINKHMKWSGGQRLSWISSGRWQVMGAPFPVWNHMS